MRRKEREISSRTEIDAIVHRAAVCRLALSDEGMPYIVPLCFGYRDNVLYFHSGKDGRKLDILHRNNRVCFEMEGDCRIRDAEEPCRWGLVYQSVVGFGRAFLVDDEEEKRRALTAIMQHYAGEHGGPWEFPRSKVDITTIIRVEIDEISGKRSL